MEQEIIRSNAVKRPVSLTVHIILTVAAAVLLVADIGLQVFYYHLGKINQGVAGDPDCRAVSDAYYRTAGRFESLILPMGLVMGALLVVLIIRLISYSKRKHSRIIVTDKRVYGTATRNRQVDLPFEAISAVGTKGKHFITVSTATKTSRFYVVDRCDEIREAIDKLISEA